jgi:hypothetical protein
MLEHALDAPEASPRDDGRFGSRNIPGLVRERDGRDARRLRRERVGKRNDRASSQSADAPTRFDAPMRNPGLLLDGHYTLLLFVDR